LKLADLHIHTQASDGWLAPSVAVEQANRAGLTAISIADHDSVAGIDAAIEAGKKHGVEVIPGVELSSGFEGRELHILGYFVDWRDKWLQNKLSAIQEARVDRAKRILEKLRSLDINISYNVTIVIAGGAVGRPKIAQAIFNRGYVQTVQEAFERYLGIDRPAYVEKYPLQPAEAIRIIQKAGGIAALAHPVFAKTDEILPQLVDQGLQAIEVYHSRHDASDTRHFEQLAKKYGLLIVGGSDAHGKEVPVGAVRISYEFVEKMKEELPNQRKFYNRHQIRKPLQDKMIASQVFNNNPPAHTFESIEGWGMKTFEMGGKLVPKEE
jgi:predicted metal-dependent phosphoesterase TrpH